MRLMIVLLLALALIGCEQRGRVRETSEFTGSVYTYAPEPDVRCYLTVVNGGHSISCVLRP